MSDIVEFNHSDDALKRAENLMRFAGFTMNRTAHALLPRVAQAIELYRDIDRAALKEGENE